MLEDMPESALDDDDSPMMVGSTSSSWSGASWSSRDFMAVKLDDFDGVTDAWRW